MIFQAPEIDAEEEVALAEIIQIRQRLRHALTTPKRWTGLLRRTLIARAIRGSNTIEGYNSTIDDAVDVWEGDDIDAPWETKMALTGYRSALSYILQLSDDPHHSFNEELVRGLHYMMLQHDPSKNPGRWRPGPIVVRHEPSGNRVYEGPDAAMVPDLMREFVESVRQRDPEGSVTVHAAMAHLNLVMIHPFPDGNGRMGRAIQTYVLAKESIVAAPFSSIEEYLGRTDNTAAYYRVLEHVGQGSWHPENDARPWIRFCLNAHLQQALTVDKRAKESARLWSELEAEIARAKLPERTLYPLFEAAMNLRVRSARYRTQAEISAQVASKDLRTLVDVGLLKPEGERRGRTYVAGDRLKTIREQTREEKVEYEVSEQRQLSLGI